MHPNELEELRNAQWHQTSRIGRQPNARRQQFSQSGNDDNGLYTNSEVLREQARRVGAAADRIALYVHSESKGTAKWVHDPEVPTAREIGHIVNGRVLNADGCKDLEPNRARGDWPEGKDFYLETQYQLFREDAVTPLREAVNEVRAHPDLIEKDSQLNARIYDNVYIVGVVLCRKTLATKIEFSTRRAEKRIRWAQSKRLKTGTIVALTPKHDHFRTVCKVAVVVSRVCSQLQVEPPTKPCIYLEWGDPSEFEYDPQQEWVMVEASQGYWEACRHTLKALQKLQGEPFPFSKHLVNAESKVGAPQYRKDQPALDLKTATRLGEPCETIDVLETWPDLMQRDREGRPLSELDSSQSEALQRILTKSLSIVQGPPGTGKTYISVVALRVLLDNMGSHDPPIIVSAHTNHALDQLLRHIEKFEPRFVRLGGQTLDKEIIEPRTIQKVRDLVGVKPSSTTRRAVFTERSLITELQELFRPFIADAPFSPECFKNLGLITHEQHLTLEKIEKDYVGKDFLGSDDPINIFCGDHLKKFHKTSEASYLGVEFEEYEDDIRPEEEDMELEFQDDKFELLHGKAIHFHTGFTAAVHPEYSDERAAGLLKHYQDLSQIPPKYRGSVYSYLQKMAKAKMLSKARGIATAANTMVNNFKIGRWEQDCAVLSNQHARVIGMTTTGLSKYRALVSSLQPKTVLIEEAAETLEAYTTVACLPSLEHLILVGDHQQLRGHCNVKEFESAPWNLDVSLFERLVNNEVEYTQLSMQRRMRPHIREIVNPIYPQLVDHPSVHDRADIPGMGGLNSCFLTHDFPESNDDMLSKQNVDEAELIVNFYAYLIQNGMSPAEITVLNFYNGQRRLISKMMSRHPILRSLKFKVVTVDSYQGEENEVILLALTRRNERNQIGFLNVDNRVCVALSRARRGMYIFGDADAVFTKSDLWRKVLVVVGEGHEQILEYLPLICQNHATLTYVRRGPDFEDLDGGCRVPCNGKMPCGHTCRLRCHPKPHEEIVCEQACMKRMGCGHFCANECWYPEHECKVCKPVAAEQSAQPVGSVPASSRPPRRTSPQKSGRPSITNKSRSPRKGYVPPQSQYVPQPSIWAPPSAYPIGPTGLPETPLGSAFRNFATTGAQQQDEKYREQAKKSYQQQLDAMASERLAKEKEAQSIARADHEARLTRHVKEREEEQAERERLEHKREEREATEKKDLMAKLEQENYRLDDFEKSLDSLSLRSNSISAASGLGPLPTSGKPVRRRPASHEQNLLLDFSGDNGAESSSGPQRKIWVDTFTSGAIDRRVQELVKQGSEVAPSPGIEASREIEIGDGDMQVKVEDGVAKAEVLEDASLLD